RSAGRVRQQRTVLTFAAGEAPARRRDGVLEEPGVGPGRLRPAVPAEQVQALCTGVFAERACRRWQADGATAVEGADGCRAGGGLGIDDVVLDGEAREGAAALRAGGHPGDDHLVRVPADRPEAVGAVGRGVDLRSW